MVFHIIFIFILLFCIFLWDYLNKKHRNELFKKAGISGPKSLPLVGNIKEFVGINTHNVFSVLNRYTDKYGKVFKVWIFSDSILIVRDATYIESILSSQQNTKKFSFYKILTSWLGDGLILSSGCKWQSQRKVIAASYHIKILEQFVEIFDQNSCVLIEKLSKKADGKSILDAFPILSLTTLDIICETAMGVKLNAQKHTNFPYTNAITYASEIFAMRILNPIFHIELLFRLLSNKSYRILKKSLDIMHNITEQVITEKRKYLKDNSANKENDMDDKKRMAFLDVMLQSTVNGKPLSSKDICDEVGTMIFAGHETTASSMAYTLYLLSRHPEVQQKVFEEILEYIGEDKDKAITMKDLQNLKYLDSVIKESLRLYPTIPIIGRVTEHDIEINGNIIPANVHIILLFYAAARDPDYFPKPDEFIPERFNSDNLHTINPFSSVPFSAGIRSCIGQKFAGLEMKCIISKVIRHFELLPLGPDVQPVLHITLRSSTGIKLGLKPRVYENL